MNRPVYLVLSILEISKTLMYEFWYDYIKPKYQYNAKLCYIDTNSFIICIKSKDVYKDIADAVEKRFSTSYYEIDTWLPKGKNKKVINEMMKHDGRINERWIRGKIMTKCVEIRRETYSYWVDDDRDYKRAKLTKMCIIKKELQFEKYENCNEATRLENIINYLEKIKINTDSLKYVNQWINIKNKANISKWKAWCFYWRN